MEDNSYETADGSPLENTGRFPDARAALGGIFVVCGAAADGLQPF
jgi:hypothetical protein